MNGGITLAVSTIVFLLASIPCVGQTDTWHDKVAPTLLESSADEPIQFLVIMNERSDLSKAALLPTGEEKGRFVFDELTRTASRSQANLLAHLRQMGVEHRSFWLINALLVHGKTTLLKQLASRDDVARLVPNPSVAADIPSPPQSQPTPKEINATEWGIETTNAPDAWALGYTGQGVVVGGNDTGLEWDHQAIINQYRGWNGSTADHDYNWHDSIHSGGGSCGADSAVPCDDHGHGTHTIGTVMGDDGGSNQIGMAPDARWIGCRNMDQGVGTPATYIECFEFFMAPYPVGGDPFLNGDPSLSAHVINNSWGCPPSEGCDHDSLLEVVENVRTAGILVVASAGNEGSSCSTVASPPAIYDATFSVGAVDSSDDIAGFSSRGPVTVDGSDRLKPDVSAPGVDVRSCLPGGGYDSWNGTSMASPHVAGLAALLISADPTLVGDVDKLEDLIRTSARPITTDEGCGGDGLSDVPNNVFGYGIMNALAAVDCIDCDDDNLCTIDQCSFEGCSNDAVEDGIECDDSLFCNGEDVCFSGECQHEGDPCDEGDECSSTCDETEENCLAPSGTPCGSSATPSACDSPDTCDGMGACALNILENGEPCDDLDPATANDSCQPGGICQGEPTGVFFHPPSAGCGCALAGETPSRKSTLSRIIGALI